MTSDYSSDRPHLLDESKYPNDNERMTFIQTYISSLDDCDLNVDQVELVEKVESFVRVSHLLWGMWGVIQATTSSIDFDYIGYSECRFYLYKE